MSIKRFVVSVVLCFVVGPVAAEEAAAPADPVGAVSADQQGGSEPTAMEQRIRKHREAFDRRHTGDERDKATRERQQAVQAQREQKMEAYLEKQKERRVLAEKWREARRKYREEQLETYLGRQEQRQSAAIKQHEEMRSRAEEQHNYLASHHEKMLQKQVDIASYHEEKRKQAEERQKKFADMRSEMEGMTPEERWNYMRKQRAEMRETADNRRRDMPPMMPSRMMPPRVPTAGGAVQAPAEPPQAE